MKAAAAAWALYRRWAALDAGPLARRRWGGWLPALQWVQWAPPQHAGEAWLTLGLDPRLSAGDWPRRWPLGLPVRCVPAAAPGRAHAAAPSVESIEQSMGEGSLATLLQARDGSPLAVTAAHVLAGSGQAGRRDPVRIAGVAGMAGRLLDWAPGFRGQGEDSGLDVALVQVERDVADALRARVRLPARTLLPAAGSAQQLISRRGSVGARMRGRLSCFMRLGPDQPPSYQLLDVLCYDLDSPSQPGDSGSALWGGAAAERALVAIHAGSAPPGSVGSSVGTPADRVLNWFGLALPQDRPAARLPMLPAPDAAAAPVDTTREADVLARTLWGEAEGEGELGMRAVAHVVLNRRDARRYWGRSVEAVCTKPYQFSCWNAGPRRERMRSLGAANLQFQAALRIAAELLAMAPAARIQQDAGATRGATHYHARHLQPRPRWAAGQTPCAEIGGHLFYRDIA